MSPADEKELYTMVEELFGFPVTKIDHQTKLFDTLQLDSLDLVEMTMELEDRFDINIEEKDAEDVKTVGDVIQMVDRLRCAA